MKKTVFLCLGAVIQLTCFVSFLLADDVPEAKTFKEKPSNNSKITKKNISKSRYGGKKNTVTAEEIAPSSNYLTSAFDPSLNNIPRSFQGHDIEKVINALGNRKKIIEKDQFETTEQFKQRVAVAADVPLYGSIKIQDILAFSLKPTTIYDADTETLTILIKPIIFHNRAFTKQNDKVALQIKSDSRANKAIGQNGYGAQVDMMEVSHVDYNLEVHNIDNLETKTTYSDKELIRVNYAKEMAEKYPNDFKLDLSLYKGVITFEKEIKIPPIDAKQLNNNISVIVLAKIIPPYTSYDSHISSATFNAPTEYFSQSYFLDVNLLELWVVDKATGKILNKFMQRNIS